MTIGISKEELLDIDPWAYNNQQDLLNEIIERCKELSPWLTIGEFRDSRFVGLCWILNNDGDVFVHSFDESILSTRTCLIIRYMRIPFGAQCQSKHRRHLNDKTNN